MQSTQHQHPLDDLNHWLINEHVGRINNKIIEYLWFPLTFLLSINSNIYTSEKWNWSGYKIDRTGSFTIVWVIQGQNSRPPRGTGVRFSTTQEQCFWKKLLWRNDNVTTEIPKSSYTIHIPWGLVVRIWRSHCHGSGSIPGMGNLWAKFFIEQTARVAPKALEPTFQISVVDKLMSPRHHYNDDYLVFLFDFDNSMVCGQGHNTSFAWRP